MTHIKRSDYKTEQEYRQAWIANFEMQNRSMLEKMVLRHVAKEFIKPSFKTNNRKVL